jgi:CheY-like chemotaxis protein
VRESVIRADNPLTRADGTMPRWRLSGEETLAAAAKWRPDLVLMDVNLPGMDGIEATRRLTKESGGPVVVLLSTYDEDEFEIAGSGAACYVAKAAFGPDRLADAWATAET